MVDASRLNGSLACREQEGQQVRVMVLVLMTLLVSACSPQRDSTPLPTKQTTIDPVMKKLEAADESARKRREEMDAAAK